MKKILLAFVCFFLPSKIAIFCLRLAGNKVSYKSKIGFSVILTDELIMEPTSRIGHLNFIRCKKITLVETAFIGHLNILRGPFQVEIDKYSSIGNSNELVRAPMGIVTGEAIFKLGEMSKVTIGHRLDLTRSISFGNYVTLAGSGSQLWTHGYYHYPEGPGRFRVDGEIVIENNVYLGSHIVINAGIKIAKSISIGSHTCISKSLTEPGMYVSQALRHLPMDVDKTKVKLTLDESNSCEIVYVKTVD